MGTVLETNDKCNKTGNLETRQKRSEVDFGQDDNGKRLRPLFRIETDGDVAIEKHEKAANAMGKYQIRLVTTARAMKVTMLKK